MKAVSVDKVNIIEHGNTYSEVEEASNRYPFMLCPECTSEDTEIDLSWNDYRNTGDCRYVRKGIFQHKMIYVRHICNSCGCKWSHEVEDADYKKGGGIVDDDMAAIIICFLLFLLLLFFTVCFWMSTNDDSPDWVKLLTALSSVVSIIFGIILCGWGFLMEEV